MKPPQVTVVVHGRWHAFDLVRELEKLGALHRLITNYPKSQTRRWDIPDEKVVSFPLTLALTKVAWKIGGEKAAMRYNYAINDLFARAAAKYLGNPDVIHAWSGAAEPSLLVARARGIPTVLERSSSHMLEQCEILREEYASLGLRWTETPMASVQRELREYQLADRVVVPSFFVERSFVARGYPTNRLYRNGFGVDLGRFTPGNSRDGIFRIIYVGSLSVRKGVHHLVRAFKEANIPNSELLLVGGRLPETDKLVGDLDRRIRRVGHVPQDQLPALYKTAAVFALASVEEGQACVQAQALACGLPLICTTNTGGEDYLALSGAGLNHGSDLIEFPIGYLVPARNASAMAAAFCALAASPDLLAAKRSAAASLAKHDLSWRRYAVASLSNYIATIKNAKAG